MPNALELIKRGVVNNNWESVCKGYKLLTGETIGTPSIEPSSEDESIDPAPKPTKKRVPKPKPVKKTRRKRASAEPDEVDFEESSNDKDGFGMGAGPVNLKNRKPPKLPFKNFVSAEERKVNRENLKKVDSTPRPPYKSLMVKCDKCGNRFDFNKQYPVGISGLLEKGQKTRLFCEGCYKH